MNKMVVAMMLKLKGSLNNERGAQSLEWLGLAALLIAVLAIVSSALMDDGSETMKGIVSGILEKISKQVQ